MISIILTSLIQVMNEICYKCIEFMKDMVELFGIPYGVLDAKSQGIISKEDIAKCRALLTPDLLELNDRFEEFISNRHKKYEDYH